MGPPLLFFIDCTVHFRVIACKMYYYFGRLSPVCFSSNRLQVVAPFLSYSEHFILRLLLPVQPFLLFLFFLEERGMSSDTSAKASQLLSAITKPKSMV